MEKTILENQLVIMKAIQKVISESSNPYYEQTYCDIGERISQTKQVIKNWNIRDNNLTE